MIRRLPSRRRGRGSSIICNILNCLQLRYLHTVCQTDFLSSCLRLVLPRLALWHETRQTGSSWGSTTSPECFEQVNREGAGWPRPAAVLYWLASAKAGCGPRISQCVEFPPYKLDSAGDVSAAPVAHATVRSSGPGTNKTANSRCGQVNHRIPCGPRRKKM